MKTPCADIIHLPERILVIEDRTEISKDNVVSMAGGISGPL